MFEMRWKIISIVYCLVSSCFFAEISTSDLFLNNGLVSTLASIRSLLKYFGQHYQEANLNLIFGLRVIEGQCKLLTESHKNGQLEFSSAELIKQINELGLEAGKLANMAIPYVHEQDREYFKHMKPLAIWAWKVSHPHRVVKPLLERQNTLDVQGFSEEVGDLCMSNLMADKTKNSKPCNLTENCMATMLQSGQTGYYLQRQVFYTILAQRMGCEALVNEYVVARTHFRDLEQVQHELCTNAYYELDDIVSLSKSYPVYRNLILEMGFICPSIGYFQFLKNDLLESILSWQTPSGCFSSFPNATGSPSINAGNSSGSASMINSDMSATSLNLTRASGFVAQPDLPNIPPPPGFDLHEYEHHQKAPSSNALASNIALQKNDQTSSRDRTGNGQGLSNGRHYSANDFVQSPALLVGPAPSIYAGGQVNLDDGVAHNVVDPSHVGNLIRGYLEGEGNSGAIAQVQPTIYNVDRVQIGGVPQQYAQPQRFLGQNIAWNGDIAYAQPYGDPHEGFRQAPRVVPHHDGHNDGYFGMPPELLESYRVQPPLAPRRVSVVAEKSNDLESNQYRQGRGLKSLQLHPITPENNFFLFKDKDLSGGCQTHFTSFAAATLAMYLRYLVDPGPPEFMHLRLENFRRRDSAKSIGRGAAPQILSSSGLDGQNLSNPSADLQDMALRANSLMGTYRRRWDSKFRPVYVGPMARMGTSQVGLQSDYVHQAEVRKELHDWTVSYANSKPLLALVDSASGKLASLPNLQPTSPSTGGSWKGATADKPNEDHVGEIINAGKESSKQVHIVELRSPLQRDLDHYLVAVAVVSVVFLLIIFRYFRRRRSALLRLKARHL